MIWMHITADAKNKSIHHLRTCHQTHVAAVVPPRFHRWHPSNLMQVGCNDKTRHHVSNKCHLASGPIDLLALAPIACLYNKNTHPISQRFHVKSVPPGSNAHHPCTNCSCSQPDMAEGLEVRLVHLLRNYCHWRPSMPLEGSCNLALFQRSWQFKYGTFRGDLNMADKEKIPWSRSWSSSLFKQFANTITLSQKKQKRKINTTHNTDFFVPSSYFGTDHSQFKSLALPFCSTNLKICRPGAS